MKSVELAACRDKVLRGWRRKAGGESLRERRPVPGVADDRRLFGSLRSLRVTIVLGLSLDPASLTR
jgi:hypothetical protein